MLATMDFAGLCQECWAGPAWAEDVDMPPAEEPPEAAEPPPEPQRPPDAAIRALAQRLHQNLNHPEPK
eukprot:5672925-Lingulodinium_polyedra.AAC.1